MVQVIGSAISMQELGWQGTFCSLGFVGGGLILSLSILFRDRSTDLGLTPSGAHPAASPLPLGCRCPDIDTRQRDAALVEALYGW